MPIEPPHPREVRHRLLYTSAATYKKAVTLAERYGWQARMAAERRDATLKKLERQAEAEKGETRLTYERQVAAAQQRYRSFLEQAHAKHRHAVHHARQAARQAEDVYKAVLQRVPGYGELQLQALALADARALTTSLVQGYRSALGPDGLGEIVEFLRAFDRVLDHARDRQMVVPVQFAEAVIKGLVQRQLRHLAASAGATPAARAEGERIKQAASGRLSAIQEVLAEQGRDTTPPSIRTIYFAVQDWLSKAPGSPFDLALDRLKLDVEATSRREQRALEDQMKVAIQSCAQAPEIRPAAEAYQAAQRILSSSEQAARNVLTSDLARVETALERELQMAEAMVVGMDHSRSKRLAQARKDLVRARKMARRWDLVLEGLQEVGAWQRLKWRLFEGFDLELFWGEVQARQPHR
ncbi:MAG: hypothetical protein VKQ33_06490 [Candidatus Sericytochromatia bacterium]|nr:hypothetical protein [Candidatus Sericytochromatia bacterium]